MTFTIEEAKAFIVSSDKFRSNWLTMAERSWAEIKKRQKNDRLYSNTPNSTKKKARYPAWYSILKIRQPLLLSRIGIPIGRDTTQDGNDNVGATAAVCKERLAVNLAKSFPYFDYLASCRDDFLVTNFSMGRAFYKCTEVKEKVKEYITPQQSADGTEGTFVNAVGVEVMSDDIYEDDEGFFIYHDETVDVENESVYLEHVLFKHVYVDPFIKHWGRCKRLAFADFYSEKEFKEIFGPEAMATLPKPDSEATPGADEAEPKNQSIKVYEYWDVYEKQCFYWADNGEAFITPKKARVPDAEESYSEDGETVNGIYNLEKLFPVPDPLIWNAATDEFWPIPEYYQVVEILDDIHTIFSRMMALTRAIRARLLFDNNIDGLEEALGEASEGDAFGVTNLTQSLAKAGGSLDNVVQYIPVEKLITSLSNMYTALEQRLNVLYKLTGTSDMLQGLITDPTQRTFGERQMTEKYALNQIAEPQRKMMEFVRSSYELLCEMALKNFKDASLDKYIMPATLSEDHKARYRAAIGLLKEDQKRFRIELETDSTIALNEDYDKKMRVELVNTLTSAVEKAANVAGQSPALVTVTLHSLKYLIQGFRQGKLFQNEITQAIDNVIKQAQSTPAPFNAEQANFALLQKKFQLEVDKANAKRNNDIGKLQIEGARANNESMKSQADVTLTQQRDSLLGQLAVLDYQLNAQKAGVEMQNKMADNRRLEEEVVIEAQRGSDSQASKQPQVIVVPTAPAAGPTIINAPNPPPQTSIVQPVQQVPVPILPGSGS